MGISAWFKDDLEDSDTPRSKSRHRNVNKKRPWYQNTAAICVMIGIAVILMLVLFGVYCHCKNANPDGLPVYDDGSRPRGFSGFWPSRSQGNSRKSRRSRGSPRRSRGNSRG